MSARRYILSVFILISYITLIVNIIVKSKFVVTKNKRISATNYGEAVTQSTAACSAVCQSSKNCTAANYIKKTGKCYLFILNSVLLEDAIGWSYFSRPQALRTLIHITHQTETWDNAKRYCESINGGLANVMSPTDQELILSILDPLIRQNGKVWIGGSDKDKEGEWIWSNGCSFDDQGFYVWLQNNPDNKYDNEHCLQLWYSKWNDANCSTSQTFVCEIVL